MSLATELQSVANSLSPSDLFADRDTGRILSAVVKVLENEGISVAEELIPKPAVTALQAAVEPAVAAEATRALEGLFARVEHVLSRLEGHTTPDEASPEPAPAPANLPPQENTAPASAESLPPAPPPAVSAGPVLPPLEGAA